MAVTDLLTKREQLGVVIDESAFAKTGYRVSPANGMGPWGRPTTPGWAYSPPCRDSVVALVEGKLYVTEKWFVEPRRCLEAGIPENIDFHTEGEMALTMIHRPRSEGLRFAYTTLDADCGYLPWLAARAEGDGEISLAEGHSDQVVHLSDPASAVPLPPTFGARG